MGRALTSNVLSKSAFWMLNKALVKHLEGSYTAAVLLTELVYRRDSIGEDEFFVLSEDLQESLSIGEKSRRAAIKKLEEANLIHITAKPTHTADKGYQTVNWFTINDDLINTILNAEGSSSPEGGPGGRWCPKDTTVVPKGHHGGPKTSTRSKKDREREEGNFSNKPTSDTSEAKRVLPEDVYSSWLSQIPERCDFKACYDELLLLFGTLHANGLTNTDISASLKKKVMSRWSKSKYPDKHAEHWDRASGAVFGKSISLVVPDMPLVNDLAKAKPMDGTWSVDMALAHTMEDDDVQRMVEEYKRIRGEL